MVQTRVRPCVVRGKEEGVSHGIDPLTGQSRRRRIVVRKISVTMAYPHVHIFRIVSSPYLPRQLLQGGHHVLGHLGVQPRGGLVDEHDRGVDLRADTCMIQ